MAASRRPLRVAELLRDHLSQALARDFSDPRLSSAVITNVSLSPDLGLATVMVRSLGLQATDREKKLLLSSLAHAAGRLRRSLGPSLRLKKLPDLRFFYDEGPEKAHRVEELLQEIAADHSSTETGEEADRSEGGAGNKAPGG